MYRTVTELTRDQLVELKQHYLCEVLDENEGRTPSWGELAAADIDISDEVIYNYYGCYSFSDDDFFGNSQGGDN